MAKERTVDEAKLKNLEQALKQNTTRTGALLSKLDSLAKDGLHISTSEEDGFKELYSKLDSIASRIISSINGDEGTETGRRRRRRGSGGGDDDSEFGSAFLRSFETSTRNFDISVSTFSSAVSDFKSYVDSLKSGISEITSGRSGYEEEPEREKIRSTDQLLVKILTELQAFHIDVSGTTAANYLSDFEGDLKAEMEQLVHDTKENKIRNEASRAERERKKREKETLERELASGKHLDSGKKLTADEKKDKRKKLKDLEDEERQLEKYRKKRSRRGQWSLYEAGRTTLGAVNNVATSIVSNEPATAGKAGEAVAGLLTGFANMAGPIVGGIGGAIVNLVKAAIEMGTKRDRAASEYARTVGGGAETRKDFILAVSEIMKGGFNWGDMVFSFDEVNSALTETSAAMGRAIDTFNKADVASIIKLKRFGIEAQTISDFETFGKSARDTEEFFAKLYGEAGSRGLSFKNVSKAVVDNLKMAQKYSFREGIDGLTAMAEKSIMLKYNMQQAASFADKVSTVESAITVSANLSVLGGNFAQFADPLSLLNESLNDVESLNERLVEMFGNMAYFDEQKKQIEMTPYDRQILRKAADAIGVSQDEMFSLTYNKARINRVDEQMGELQFNASDKVKDYIRNIANLDEQGNARVTINGQEKYLNQLTAGDEAALKKESELRDNENGANLGTIYRSTSNIAEKLDNLMLWLQEKLGTWMMTIIAFMTKDKDLKAEMKLRNIKDDNERSMATSYYTANNGGMYGSGKEFANRIRSSLKNRNDLYDDIVEFNNGTTNANGAEPTNIENAIPGMSQFTGIQKVHGPSHAKGGVIRRLEGNEWIIPNIPGLEDDLRDMRRNGYNARKVTYNTNEQIRQYEMYMKMANGTVGESKSMMGSIQNGLSAINAGITDIVASNNMSKFYNPMSVIPSQQQAYAGPQIPSSFKHSVSMPDAITLNFRFPDGDMVARQIDSSAFKRELFNNIDDISAMIAHNMSLGDDKEGGGANGLRYNRSRVTGFGSL